MVFYFAYFATLGAKNTVNTDVFGGPKITVFTMFSASMLQDVVSTSENCKNNQTYCKLGCAGGAEGGGGGVRGGILT